MPRRHLRNLAFTATVALIASGVAAGAAQAADPTPRIRDANPAQTRDLSGRVSKATSTRALPAAPGQEMKGIIQDGQAAPPIQPSDTDRKAGAGFRTSGADGGMTTPIGTLNIVRGEQPRAQVDNSIAEVPPAQPDMGVSRSRF